MRWKVSVTRIATASRDIEVEADTRDEAESKAEEQACNEDFTCCVNDYEFGVDGAIPVEGESEETRDDQYEEMLDLLRQDVEPEDDLVWQAIVGLMAFYPNITKPKVVAKLRATVKVPDTTIPKRHRRMRWLPVQNAR